MKEDLVKAGNDDDDHDNNVSNGDVNDDQIMLTMMFKKGEIQTIDYICFFFLGSVKISDV